MGTFFGRCTGHLDNLSTKKVRENIRPLANQCLAVEFCDKHLARAFRQLTWGKCTTVSTTRTPAKPTNNANPPMQPTVHGASGYIQRTRNVLSGDLVQATSSSVRLTKSLGSASVVVFSIAEIVTNCDTVCVFKTRLLRCSQSGKGWLGPGVCPAIQRPFFDPRKYL